MSADVPLLNNLWSPGFRLAASPIVEMPRAGSRRGVLEQKAMPSSLQLTTLQDAVGSLQQVLELYDATALQPNAAAGLQNALRAAVVKNFEFVFDRAIKMMRRRLEIDALEQNADSFAYRTFIRTAAEYGLIDEVMPWFEYRELRKTTAHTYEITKANIVCQRAPDLLVAATVLLNRLKERNDAA